MPGVLQRDLSSPPQSHRHVVDVGPEPFMDGCVGVVSHLRPVRTAGVVSATVAVGGDGPGGGGSGGGYFCEQRAGRCGKRVLDRTCGRSPGNRPKLFTGSNAAWSAGGRGFRGEIPVVHNSYYGLFFQITPLILGAMKLTIGKDQLLTGLNAVQNVVGSRTTMAILTNVLLKAQENRLELTATNLDVSIISPVSATVREPGLITLPAKRFFGIVRELGAPEIDLVLEEGNVCSIRAGASFYKIHGLPAEDYPPLPQFNRDRRVILDQKQLKTMLRRTAFAVSTDESRYVLNGIFFSLKENKVALVATDGRRLALTEGEVEIPADSHGDFIVPTMAINELGRLLQETGRVELRFGENQASFTLLGENGLDTVIISKLVEGAYPNYRQVIPAEPQERLALPREEFLQALRRAEIMTSDKSNSVKLSFGKNQVVITANSPEIGEAKEVITVNYKGKEFAIAFNPAYLMDPLKALDQEEVFFELIDELSPGVIKVNEPFLYVIMPMRIS